MLAIVCQSKDQCFSRVIAFIPYPNSEKKQLWPNCAVSSGVERGEHLAGGSSPGLEIRHPGAVDVQCNADVTLFFHVTLTSNVTIFRDVKKEI